MALSLNEHSFETRDWRWRKNRCSNWRGLRAIFSLLGSLSTTQEICHKFPYLTIKKNPAVSHALQVHFSFLYTCTLSTTRNDLFCCYVDDVSTCMVVIFNFFFLLSPNCWYQLNFRIPRIHFASTTSNNWEILAKTPSYIFGWRSRCRRRRLCWTPNYFSGDCISTDSQ